MPKVRQSRIAVSMTDGMIATIDIIVGVNREYLTRSDFLRAAAHLLMILEIIKDHDIVHLSESMLKEAQKEGRLGKEADATLEI